MELTVNRQMAKKLTVNNGVILPSAVSSNGKQGSERRRLGAWKLIDERS